MTFTSIPIVDVSAVLGSDDTPADFAAEFTDICHHVGFALVTNHGISTELQAETFDLMKRFFDCRSRSNNSLTRPTRHSSAVGNPSAPSRRTTHLICGNKSMYGPNGPSTEPAAPITTVYMGRISGLLMMSFLATGRSRFAGSQHSNILLII